MTGNSTSQAPARRRLVAVIGDANVPAGSQKDLLAEEVGRLLVDAGFRVLTGGLGGVMESACRGARSSARYQSGDTVAVLPGHDPGEANEFVDVAIPSGLDHVRNSIVAHADAVIAIGGGAGTMSEICLAWIYKRLIVALRVDGWSGRIADQRVDERVRYPDESDDRVFGAASAEDAVRTVVDRVGRFTGQHRTIRRRDAP
ncbi:TIGR00725 family protein [uncultured Brevundimonas sp.]|uniref:TIGR00725 family protein n=1 Tax=uncultured Brevundimonas sp. TaxID=213418 RepID=UPI0026127E9E|nr:TIGR00725 family protein [uncultured Brevundimonas sp.]